MENNTKTEQLQKLIDQHEKEIKEKHEWCEQRIIWQDGKIVRYEKLEKYQ